MWIINTILWLLELFSSEQKAPPGPELSEETQRRLRVLFAESDWALAEQLLFEQCGNNLPALEKLNAVELERYRFAALKLSDGSLDKLSEALVTAKSDWRDLLTWAGFGDLETHQQWEPKPNGAPDEMEPLGLSPRLHEKIQSLLVPIGFGRRGSLWRRFCSGGLAQTVTLVPSLEDRESATFFLKVELMARPMPVMIRLPRQQGFAEQGYRFNSTTDPSGEIERMASDLLPVIDWLQRFGSNAEVQRGFVDGTFDRHMRVEGTAFFM